MIKNLNTSAKSSINKEMSLAVRNIKKGFKVSSLESELLAQKCKSAGLTESEYVRTVALYDAIVIANNSSNLIKTTVELNRVGNNLNQIARSLNSGDSVTNQLISEINTTLTSINLLVEILNQQIKKESNRAGRRAQKCQSDDMII